MRRRFHFIGNPSAGRGRDGLARDVANRLARTGAVVRKGSAASEAEVLAEASAAVWSGAADAVIAAGGDGTVRLAAKAVAGTGVALGVIPLGTGNVLAHEVALPRDAEGLARLLLEGEATPIHTATANGELFLLMAGAGFDGRIVAALDHSAKNRIGKLAYVRPLLGALWGASDQLAIDIDGAPHTATWAVIANARCYGGAFVMAPRTGIAQVGLQAVLFHGNIRHHRLAQLIALGLGRLEARVAAQNGDVSMHAARRVSITSPAPVPTQLDGDAFAMTPLLIEAGGPEVRLIRPPVWPG